MTAEQWERRWDVRATRADGSTVYYPMGLYKRAANLQAHNLRESHPEYVKVEVIDGWEEA